MTLSVVNEGMATTLVGVDPSTPVLQPAFPWIVFDMDGTLVDTLGLNLDALNYAVKGFLERSLSVDEASAVPSGTLGEQLASFIPVSAIPQATERFLAYYTSHFGSGTRFFPGLRGLLFTLQARGVELAVCTGAGRSIADYTLERFGLSQFFRTIVTVDDVSEPKPDPEGLRTVMETIGADCNHTVYIGDHPDDIEASRKAGVKSAGALWGSMYRDELHSLKPDFLFKHPSQAPSMTIALPKLNYEP